MGHGQLAELNASRQPAAEGLWRIDSLTRIDVTTTQGAVALSGSVEKDDMKRRAEEVAKQVVGVRRVDNNLQVRN